VDPPIADLLDERPALPLEAVAHRYAIVLTA
jgi:hypothetical protein